MGSDGAWLPPPSPLGSPGYYHHRGYAPAAVYEHGREAYGPDYGQPFGQPSQPRNYYHYPAPCRPRSTAGPVERADGGGTRGQHRGHGPSPVSTPAVLPAPPQ